MKVDYWQRFEENHYYHIYNHAADTRNIFTTEIDYQDFLNKHYKYLACVFNTIAYCLMPNHFHFIVKVKAVDTILKATKKEQSKVNIAFQKGRKDTK